MRITTWNINSVRLRIGLALKLLDQSKPDVLCLQETKCPDEQFPFEAFRDIGYKYITVNGMKAYNGVALVSRVPFESELALDWTERSDCRHISILVEKGCVERAVAPTIIMKLFSCIT